MKNTTWTDKDLEYAVRDNLSLRQVILSLGQSTSSGSYKTIRAGISRLGLDTSHFVNRPPPVNRPSLDEMLVNGSRCNQRTVKKRLVDEGILEYKCSICGQEPEWDGKPLIMILDHINGTHADYRIENLRLVCPNCDTQLPTFCRGSGQRKKNVRRCVDCGTEISRRSTRCTSCAGIHRSQSGKLDKIKWPNNEALLVIMEDLNWNYSAAGRQLGVSDNAVRKHMKKYST